MKFTPLPFFGAFLISPEPFEDERGMLARLYCDRELAEIGFTDQVVQINHSRTVEPGAIRGMHFQYPPKSETKIVKCIKGEVFDVLVDIRKASPTFLMWHGERLSALNMQSVLIPPGFAHGFQVIEPDSELLYLHTAHYSPDHEGGFRFDDERVGITWPVEVSVVSERDRAHPKLDKNFEGIGI